jgi:hypothetical protein
MRLARMLRLMAELLDRGDDPRAERIAAGIARDYGLAIQIVLTANGLGVECVGPPDRTSLRW